MPTLNNSTNLVKTTSNIIVLDNEGNPIPIDFFTSDEVSTIKYKHNRCAERGWVEDNPVYYIHHIDGLGIYFHAEPFTITHEGMPRELENGNPLDPLFSLDRW